MSADEEREEIEDDELDEQTSDESEGVIETRSSESHKRLREQMEAEVEASLRSGGKIEQVVNGSSQRAAPATASVGDLM